MDPTLAQRIRDDNRSLHDAPGYADFYDDQLALVRNPWEQRLFRDDLGRIAARLPRPCRALDLGCGTGNLTLKLIELGADVTGVDLSAGMIARLQSKLQSRGVAEGARPGVRLIVSDVDAYLANVSQRFDLVCACSFLHHLPDYLATLTAAARAVAPGGCLYVAHEPLRFDRVDRVTRWLEWLDFKWQRFEARTGLGGRVARVDPYYHKDCLADYWAMTRGIDADVVATRLRDAGLSPTLRQYDSKRHRLMHVAARYLNARHLLRFEAWRPV
ncbi:MAG: class I SAM-dependent methyltransferase [Phycisphaerae bacterium]